MEKSLDELDVGITRFVSSVPGFSAVLKHRYADFIVNEVDREGRIVRLTSLDLPPECMNVNEEGNTTPTSDRDYSEEIESFRALCGDVDAESLKLLLEKILAKADDFIDPIVLSPDADKSHRSEVHNFFKAKLKFLVTDTVEGSDGIQKCIRVRLSSSLVDRGDRRGKKRKSSGNSGYKVGKSFDSRDSEDWQHTSGKFLRFHLYKENKDTQEALSVIGKMLGIQQRSFGFAGTKDKRSVSTQQVTIFKVQSRRMAALNDRLFGIKTGDFCYVNKGLYLGQLMGNHFTITLRNAIAESDDVIETAADSLGKNGFINYYGLQRFGSGSVPTHHVGAALLRGEWNDAVGLILDPREGERDDIKKAREHFKEHGDTDLALRSLPRFLVAEKAILQSLKKCPGNYLQALKAVPRTLRMMYVHSYQSYLWNHAASMRFQKYGVSQVVLGDLVYQRDSFPTEATLPDKSEVNEECCSYLPEASDEVPTEEMIQHVKVVGSKDLLEGNYTIDDVVLPLPGSEVLLPGNEVADVYHEIAGKDGISLTDSAHGIKEFSITSMKGGYRRVLQRPKDFKWQLIKYSDDDMPLAETDWDVLQKKNVLVAHDDQDMLADEKSGSLASDHKSKDLLNSRQTDQTRDCSLEKLALKLEFTLPASSYATMAIRELQKASTSVSAQKRYEQMRKTDCEKKTLAI